MRSSVAIGLAAMLLSACGGGSGGEEANNSGMTANEALAMNEAEDVTDASPDSLVAADDNALGNGEMPAEEMENMGELPVADEAATNAQ